MKKQKYILVINSGSSSLKYALFEIANKKPQLTYKGVCDGIGLKRSLFNSHKRALKRTLKKLKKEGIIEDFDSIKIIAHRVVHGGEKHKKSVRITDKIIKDIKDLCKLAPLHNSVNLEGIIACKKLMKTTKQIAVFDTSFYNSLPEKAYLYALPRELYKNHNIRRYGFHGTSHKYVTQETLKLLKVKNPKIITVHLGNGCSITGSINGEAVETSMGFTPLEGVIMGTRSGSIDPSIPLYLQKILKKSPGEIDKLLNGKSGLLALSEISSDMRILYAASKKKNKKAIVAMEMFCYQIAKSIAGTAAAMNGVDAITFTASIGENAFYIRRNILKYLEFLGIKINPTKNRQNSQKIHKLQSKVKIFVIPTNESLQIAYEALTH